MNELIKKAQDSYNILNDEVFAIFSKLGISEAALLQVLRVESVEERAKKINSTKKQKVSAKVSLTKKSRTRQNISNLRTNK